MFTLADQIRTLTSGPLTARRVAKTLHVPVDEAEHVLHGLAAHGELLEGGVPDGPAVYWPATVSQAASRHPSAGR
jgi:hypothetical protein